jgi:chromate transport protein ChrA
MIRKHLKDNHGKGAVIAIVAAVLAVFIVFIGFILVFNDSPIILSVKGFLEGIWRFITGIFTKTPAAPSNPNVVV